MRKRVMLCEKHGYVLFRCKRKCWNAGGKFYSDYKEECFKCISEGSYKTTKTIEKKTKHLRL